MGFTASRKGLLTLIYNPGVSFSALPTGNQEDGLKPASSLSPANLPFLFFLL